MKKILSLLFSIFLLHTGHALAADEKETFTQLLQEDSVDISTIATYPETVRLSVFEVCTQPQGIANINDIQKSSQEQFRSMLSLYSKEDQQKIWNLTRYKGLIGKLVSVGQLSKTELEGVLKDYPADAHDDAMSATLHNFDLLKTVNGINNRFDLAFEDAIKNYGPVTQNAFRDLLKTPELISLLNNNMHMAVHLGDIYQKNPGYLTQQFNAISLEQAQQKARDLEEWKQTMQNDPDAANELQQSAKEYAAENGYSESTYYETDPTVITQYVYLPYPYWAGYPYWYTYEWWYPYPYWYHWGFCHWHGSIFWYSPPSWYFVHWHFHHHPHFEHYPHVTNVYVNYYHGHHRLDVKAPAVVNQWIDNNKEVLPKDFTTNRSNRVEVIKDYGRFVNNYDSDNKAGMGKIDRNEYLKTNVEKYPTLKPAVQEPVRNKGEEKWNPATPERKEPKYNPANKNPEVKPNVEPRQQQPDRTVEPKQQPRQPQQQPYQPKQNVQPQPGYQPHQKVEPRPDVQPRPVQPQQNYQPRQNVQPVQPHYQPAPRPNNPSPRINVPKK